MFNDEMQERAFEEGQRAALTRIMRMCLRELGGSEEVFNARQSLELSETRARVAAVADKVGLSVMRDDYLPDLVERMFEVLGATTEKRAKLVESALDLTEEAEAQQMVETLRAFIPELVKRAADEPLEKTVMRGMLLAYQIGAVDESHRSEIRDTVRRGVMAGCDRCQGLWEKIEQVAAKARDEPQKAPSGA